MSESLIVKNKSDLPRQAKRTADTHFDRIWKYYYTTDKSIALTPHEEVLRQRWELAWQHDCTLLNARKICKRIQRQFGVTERTAYKDIRMARLLFSDPREKSKTARREILNSLIEMSLRKAIAREDFKAAEKLMLRYDRNNGLSVETTDPMQEMMKKQKPAVIIFSADPSTLKKQADDMIKDVDHEEIPREDG